MNSIIKILNKEIVKSIIFIFCVAIFLFLIKSILNLVLLTFIITYLVNSLEKFLAKKFGKNFTIKKGIVTMIIYIILIAFIIFVFVKYVPLLIVQIASIIKQADNYYIDITKYNLPRDVRRIIIPILAKIDLKNYTQSGMSMAFKAAGDVAKWSGNVLIALILSLFFMIEKERVLKFVHKFKYSKVSGIYNYFEHFGGSFLNSFGKVINAQVVIAIVNTTISVIFLAIFGFPKLLALGFMIFILSLIPVAGVIISLVPLSLIAFKIGGIMKVLDIIIMIAVIHVIESYILNPKLMSENTKLPIFFTFVVLIFSEHFLGFWGLLLGIPLFMFFVEVLGVNVNDDKKVVSNKNDKEI
ncbi:MAG: AI-2E family transporter [Clostridium sp.]|nr:AI-2E family transporter [Clostridium sp.]